MVVLCKKSWKAGLLCMGLAGTLLGGILPFSAFTSNAEAAKQVVHLHDPVQVVLQTTLDAEKSQFGDPFRAVIPEDLEYKGNVIPAGTELSGQIIHFQRESYRFNWPAWVGVDIQKATLPSGTTVSFDKEHLSKVYSPEAKGAGRFTRNALPLWITSTATSVPLRIATGLNGGVVTAISTGARTVVGMVMEGLKSPAEVAYDNPPQAQEYPARLGFGALRGVGVVGAYQLARQYPVPKLGPGEDFWLRFNDNDLRQLFETNPQMVKH